MFAVLERVNRGQVAVWLKSLIASAAVIHEAVFVRLMIADAKVPSFGTIDRMLMIAICCELLAMPSAMLHAAVRLTQTGIDARPPRDQRYVLLYAAVCC